MIISYLCESLNLLGALISWFPEQMGGYTSPDFPDFQHFPMLTCAVGAEYLTYSNAQ